MEALEMICASLVMWITNTEIYDIAAVWLFSVI